MEFETGLFAEITWDGYEYHESLYKLSTVNLWVHLELVILVCAQNCNQDEIGFLLKSNSNYRGGMANCDYLYISSQIEIFSCNYKISLICCTELFIVTTKGLKEMSSWMVHSGMKATF